LIRQAANIASRAHHAALSIARAGVTMGEIVSTVHDVYVRENAQSTGKFQISEFIFFHQEDRESPYQGYSGLQRDAVLKPGDHVYIDLFPMYQHYFADTARLWSAGEPPYAGGIATNQPIPPFRHYTLEPGMVFAVECFAKAQKLGGHCCMEDNVLVTKDGYELLDTVGRGLHIV